MAKQDSFNKAAKTASFKAAAQKMNVVNFAAEFKKRGIVVENSGVEK